MNRLIHRRGALVAGLALGASLVGRPASACEYFGPTLRVTHPWTRATAPGATTAMVCMKFDEVTQADRLIRVETPVATGADMGGQLAGPRVDFAVPEGRETLLSETGTYLRLLGLNFALEVGRSYPLVLVFERGGAMNATVTVDFDRFA